MEDGKKYLTLPSNYVTLAQLQERWLNEQQRKQREKEEEERKQREKEEEKRKQREKEEEKRKQREKEEGKRKREVQENRRQSKNGEKIRTNSVSISSHRPFQTNFRNQSEKNRRTVKVSEPKVDESGSEAINYQKQNGDESKKKKNNNNNKKKWKERRSRAQKDLTEGTAQLPPENEPVEKVPVVVTEMNSEKEKTGSEILPNGESLPGNELEEEIPVVMTKRNGEKEGVRSNFRPKGKSLVVYGKVWEQKGLLDGSAEIRPNFKNLSLNGGKESNQRLAEMNRGHGKYNRGFGGFGRFDRPSTRKPVDANLVWVRKEEISDADADAARTQISGGGKGKNPKQLRQKESNYRE